MVNRFQNMLDAGYEPGKTYNTTVNLCFCGKRAEYVVRTHTTDHVCAEHYQMWKKERAR